MNAPLEMNPEVRARWTAALRSGKYPQARQALYDGGGYCCLGVLCELARQEDEAMAPLRYVEDAEDGGDWQYGGQTDILPDSVRDWAGLSSGNPLIGDDGIFGPTLVNLNDDRYWSFTRIADAIDGTEPGGDS